MAADFRIGKWIVQPQRAIIECGNETVHLSPRAMAVLVHLAEAKGAVVSRNQLLDAVWPRMAVTQDALSQCIVELRKAFRDDSKNPRVIETIPKVGLRLMASAVAAQAGPTTTRRMSWRIAAALTLAVGGTFLGLASWFSHTSTSPEVPAENADRRSVAVLPFHSEDQANDRAVFFAESIHDELLSQLAKIGALEVTVARSSATDRKSIREIGREAHAASVLAAQIHTSGDAVRLTVQLIDTETNRQLWAGAFPAELTPEKYFEIQREITVNIADALDATLAPESLAALRNVPTANRQAYELYLTGNDYFRHSNDREQMLKYAIESYAHATEADPRFALAWARLGLVHTGMYWFGFDRTPARLKMANDAIRTAFDLAPDLAEAHLANANYLYRGLGRFEDALTEFETAERAMPRDADLHTLRSSLHRRLGHWQDAERDGEKAISIDPTNVLYLSHLAYTHMAQRDYANAEHYFDWINQLRPDDAATYVDRVALALYRDGDTSPGHRYEASEPTKGYRELKTYPYTRWLTAIFDRDYQGALDALDRVDGDRIADSELGRCYAPKDLLYARTYRLTGKNVQAGEHLQSVERSAARRLSENVDEDAYTKSCWYMTLAEAQAGLGRSKEALESMADALALVPKATNAVEGAALQLAAVIRVLVPVGEIDAARSELKDYFAHPGFWSATAISKDPRLDALRGHALPGSQ
jgi:DNA-binding winged helix-turn-helix (wHTH) protein/TolB-like protein/Tfp pilus assembly protein PilF